MHEIDISIANCKGKIQFTNEINAFLEEKQCKIINRGYQMLFYSIVDDAIYMIAYNDKIFKLNATPNLKEYMLNGKFINLYMIDDAFIIATKDIAYTFMKSNEIIENKIIILEVMQIEMIKLDIIYSTGFNCINIFISFDARNVKTKYDLLSIDKEQCFIL